MSTLLSPAQALALPTVLVLASGRGERFTASGGMVHKLQADLCGKTVLQRTLEAVQQSGLLWHLEDAGHPGMGDSIAAAVQVTRNAAGWLILPADLPLVAAQTLVELAQASPSAQVLVPVHGGQRGHPVRFSRACGDALVALRGPSGAAAVVSRFHALHWPVSDPGCLCDVDTLSDLERVRDILNTYSNK